MKDAITIMEDIDINDIEVPSNLLTAAMVLAIVYVSAVLFPTVAILLIVIKCRRHRCLRILFPITLFLEFALSMTCMLMALISSGNYGKRANELKELDDAVQGCMDQYSAIPDEIIDNQLESPIKEGKAAAQTLATFAAVVVAKIIVIVILACCIRRKGKMTQS